MKGLKIFSMLLMVALTMTLTSCMHRTEIGSASVILEKYGDNKGVQPKAVGPGNYFESWGQNYYDFPTFKVNYTFTASSTEGSKDNEEFTFQTKEGMECAVDLGIAMHFDFDKLPHMYTTYHKQVEEIRSIVLRNTVRDALNRISGNMPVESVYGAGKGLLIDSVKKVVTANLKNDGILIDNIYLIGSVRIPKSIKDALDAKVAMTQDAQKEENKVALATAHANIAIAEAKGRADARKIEADAEEYYNQKVSKSLTPALVELQRLKVWDGKYPTTYGVNGGLLIK